jgi:hypothetical protein
MGRIVEHFVLEMVVEHKYLRAGVLVEEVRFVDHQGQVATCCPELRQ